MRKVFKLDGELCANCAGKNSGCCRGKLPGVNKVSVNAMTYKLTVDAEDDAFEGVVDQIVKLFADIEPDCEIVPLEEGRSSVTKSLQRGKRPQGRFFVFGISDVLDAAAREVVDGEQAAAKPR